VRSGTLRAGTSRGIDELSPKSRPTEAWRAAYRGNGINTAGPGDYFQ